MTPEQRKEMEEAADKHSFAKTKQQSFQAGYEKALESVRFNWSKFNTENEQLSESRARIAVLEGALKYLWPECDHCDKRAIKKFDSQGEGFYWLCEHHATAEEFSGVLQLQLPDALSSSPSEGLTAIREAIGVLHKVQQCIPNIPSINEVVESLEKQFGKA